MGSITVSRLALLALHLSLVVTLETKPHYDFMNLTTRVLEQFHVNQVENVPPRVYDVIGDLAPKSIITANIQRSLQTPGRQIVSDLECDQQFGEFVNGVMDYESWALKMIDSSSKIPSGILKGNLKDIGVYDECLEIEVETVTGQIRGRHCMYTAAVTLPNINLTLSPTFSICVPAACYGDYVREILQEGINMTSSYYPVDLKITSVKCSAVDPEPWNVGGIITIVVLSIYVSFLIICTICDLFFKRSPNDNEKSLVNELSKFSLYTNAKRILSTKIPRGNLPGLQGIRFFSMGWVVLGHVYYIYSFGVISNQLDAAKWRTSWAALYIVIAPFTVDTFFVMSGFLIAYLFIKEMAKGRKFNIVMYYVHRYLRLTPAFAAVLVLNIYIFPRLGSGAIWESNMLMQQDFCSKNWWATLLYVHNYVNTEYLMCLGHSWYLAVDMQLFWLSPLIVYPLAKKPKIGLVILSAFMTASVLAPAIISGKEKYSGGIFLSSNATHTANLMRYYYITSHTRAGPWLMGIFAGYKLAVMKTHKLNLKTVTFGWILAALCFAFGFFTYRVFQADGYEYELYWELFYAGFARHIWAFGVCWLIYACILGYAGIIGRFLALPIFMPLGRISYCIYLVHFIFQLMRISAVREPEHFSNGRMTYLFFSDFVLCILWGFLLSLFFESPFMVLEKMLFHNKKDHSNVTKQVQESSITVGVVNHGYLHDDIKKSDFLNQ